MMGLQRYGAPLLLALLLIATQWRLVLSSEFTWLEAPGILEHTLPVMQLQAGEVHHLRVPLWDPYTNGGTPLIGSNAVPSPFYPPHLLLLAMPLNEGWLFQSALHWYFVAILLAIALATYFFAHRGLQLTTGAALAAGIAFPLAAVSITSQPQELHACVWIPLTLLAVLRRNVWATGLALGLCWLPGGNPVLPLALTLSAAAWFVLERWSLRAAAGALLLSFAAGALAILPAIEFRQWPVWQAPAIPGIVTLGLAFAIAAVATPKRRFLALLAASALLAGSPLLFAFAAAIGAAAGIECVRDSRQLARILLVTGAVIIVVSTLGWTVRHPNFTPSGGPALLPGFLALALGLLFLYGGPQTVAGLALTLLLAEASTTVPYNSRFDTERPRKLERLASGGDIVAFLQRYRGDIPLAMLDPAEYPFDFGRWWGVETASADTAVLPAGAAYWVSRQPRPGFDQVLFTGASGVNVYGIPKAPLRFRLTRAEPCAAEDGDSAEYTERFPALLHAKVNAACPGRLLPGFAYAPGWHVKVDGKSAELTPVGIAIPAGAHEVKMAFRPISARAGGGLSAAVFLAAAAVWVARRRRNKL